MLGREPTASEYLDAAREMAATGRPTLARLLAEEAAERTTDPQEAARILQRFPPLARED
ncbi:hypothetical protein [Streptomyces litchfieldiae]|uniref:Uncharacterized protein n=1 Tax=Streptomyces litchfieldiae TaxID=3075543 RepID=A0ABU2MJX7_9ACTN|nr:hypothetical protein [Streptomyces sp. DSM 44938]MDT0341915.1 hypothetical protein [Streptomyces sp. DSM 44938]